YFVLDVRDVDNVSEHAGSLTLTLNSVEDGLVMQARAVVWVGQKAADLVPDERALPNPPAGISEHLPDGVKVHHVEKYIGVCLGLARPEKDMCERLVAVKRSRRVLVILVVELGHVPELGVGVDTVGRVCNHAVEYALHVIA